MATIIIELVNVTTICTCTIYTSYDYITITVVLSF